MRFAALGVLVLLLTGCAHEWLRLGEQPAEAPQAEVSQHDIWMTQYEAQLSEVLQATPYTLARRDGQLVVTLPVDQAFKRERVLLLPATLAPLGRVAQLVKQHPQVRVQIQGHTDSSGSQGLNQLLSEERARAVAALFSLAGARHQVQLLGKGETQPLYSNQTADGRAANRRVELWFSPVVPSLLADNP